MAAMVVCLKILKRNLFPRGNSDLAETQWEALGRHGDLELLILFHSDIQDGGPEILQTTSSPKCELSPNLMGGIGAT